MARILVYTSPAVGHLFPALGPATALAERGHDVHVVTLAGEVERVRALGLEAEAIDPRIEARVMDDHLAKNPIDAIQRSINVMSDRAPFEVEDLRAAVARTAPDVVLVDTNCNGARTAAEASGLPWCVFQPFFTPLPSPEVPPFGPGFPLATGLLGKARDALLRPLILGKLEGLLLPPVNALRTELGLAPVPDVIDFFTRPHRTLYFTAEALEYPRRDWPASFEMVGPATWGPKSEAPAWLEDATRPIVLVTCSTEAQGDRVILENALAGLGDDVFVVGTSAAEDPASFDVPDHARVERFLPHDAILERAAAVVCHGGMGITQRALSKSVPVCVVPFGRDQHEVARRVEHAGAGVRLPKNKLSPARMRAAVERTRACAGGAARIASAFREAGGSARAASIVEELCDDADAPHGRADSAASAA